MKTKLSFLFLAATFIAYSQTPISSFNSADLSEYVIVTATLDHSASGAGVTWNFNSLSITGNSTTDTHSVPTAGELSAYPGSTSVLTVTELPSATSSKVFTKDVASTVSITGATGDSFDLNYVTDNALIGTFPLSFGYSNSDAVAGNFSGVASGTFTGTILTDVDAHGILNMNDVGSGTFSSNVTRLKTVQNLNLLISGFISGTVTQTSYNYYDTNGDLVLRTTDINISIPALGISENTSLIESMIVFPLKVNRNELLSNKLIISPNPASDFLNINFKIEENINSIRISDLTGKVILKTNESNTSINIGHLQTGFYFVTVSTENGITTRKFIKK